MLTAMRDAARTTVAKVFLIVVSIAVVAGLGFGGYFGNIGQRTVLAVGDAEISAETFQIALQRQLNRLSQQLGQPITREQARLFGLEQQLLGQLASEAALDSEADRLNIGVSDGRLAERIASDPIFLQTGGFNRQFFNQVLRSYGITEDEFVADTRSFAARQQLAQGLVGGMVAPTTMLEIANTYANEQRVVSFIALTEAALDAPEAPTEDALRTFFADRQGDYRAPEYRALQYMTVSEDSLADPAAVPLDEVQRAYERQVDALTRSGERNVTQLLFQDAAQAETARARLSAGESLADLQADASLSFTATDLGSVQRSAILDEAAGDAAFALPEPGPTEVVDGRFGSLVLLVTAITADEVTPLAEVEDRLRREIASVGARDELFALFDSIEDARAAGDTLAQIAERFDLPLVTVEAYDANGQTPEGTPADLPATDSLLAESFETDVGLENDVIETNDGGFVWYEVTGITADRDLTFEEARARVEADFEADRLDTRLRERAGELVAELERGRTLETLSIALDVPLQVTAPFTRGEAPDELGGPATVAAFEGAEGHVGDVEGPGEASRLVFVVSDVTRPAIFAEAADVQALEEELAPALEDAVITQYVGALQRRLGVTINQDLHNQLLGAGS